MTKIAILGGGQIGEALTSGLVASGFAGSDITVTNRTESRSQELEQTYGVNTTSAVSYTHLTLPTNREV